jgi:hypothetical protein
VGSQDYVKRILEAMSGVLQPAAFRKKGLVFTAERENVFHVVQLWKERSTTRQQLDARLMVGAFSPNLARACAERDRNVNVDELVKDLPPVQARLIADKVRAWAERGGDVDASDRPSDIQNCHWMRQWPQCISYSAASLEQALTTADDIVQILRETVLQELGTLAPASRLHDVLYRGKNLGNPVRTFTCLRLLMEWAAAEGKLAYYGNTLLTEEFFPSLSSPASLD